MKTAEEILRDEVAQNPDGYTVYFDYTDKISKETFAEAFSEYKEMVNKAKENGEEPEYPKFEDYLTQAVYEKWNMWELEAQTIEDNFKDNRSPKELVIVQEYLDENDVSLSTALSNFGFAGATWDVNDIMDKYELNLIFATEKEQDYDMGSVHDMFSGSAEELMGILERMSPDEQDAHFDNALSYLIAQQGFELHQIADVLFTGEECSIEFIQSLADELREIDCSGYGTMSGLTALVGVSDLDFADKLIKGEGSISISKDTTIGLYDQYHGSGSNLGISLAKDFEVPASMIQTIQIEGGKEEAGRYSVNDTYGLVSSAWGGTAKPMEKNVDKDVIMKKVKDDVESTIDTIALHKEQDKEKE